jgi:hypothetical protein
MIHKPSQQTGGIGGTGGNEIRLVDRYEPEADKAESTSDLTVTFEQTNYYILHLYPPLKMA